MNSLEDFLVPGAVDQVNATIEAARDECKALVARVNAAKRVASAKPKAKAKGKAASTRKQVDIKKVKADAAEAKKSLTKLSQQLVLKLVKLIEEKKLLKPAMALRPTT